MAHHGPPCILYFFLPFASFNSFTYLTLSLVWASLSPWCVHSWGWQPLCRCISISRRRTDMRRFPSSSPHWQKRKRAPSSLSPRCLVKYVCASDSMKFTNMKSWQSLEVGFWISKIAGRGGRSQTFTDFSLLPYQPLRYVSLWDILKRKRLSFYHPPWMHLLLSPPDVAMMDRSGNSVDVAKQFPQQINRQFYAATSQTSEVQDEVRSDQRLTCQWCRPLLPATNLNT